MQGWGFFYVYSLEPKILGPVLQNDNDKAREQHCKDCDGRQDDTATTGRELAVGEHGLVVEVARGAEPQEQDP